MTEPNQPERRLNKRVSFRNNVNVEGLGLFQSLNISIGGMYLEALIPYYATQGVLKLNFKPLKKDINVQGQIIYNYNPRGIGVSFLNLTPEDRREIEKLIEV